MKEESLFDAWAARARREPAPPADVVAGVLRRIQASPPRREVDWLWLTSGAISVLAASAMLMLALQRWESLTDPLAGMFSALTLVLQ
jgi:hypothetical protein